LPRYLDEADCLHLLVEPWAEGDMPLLDIAETVRRSDLVAKGQTDATFSPDVNPLNPLEINSYLRLLETSRQSLLQLKRHVPASVYGFRSRPGRKTIGEQLLHIAGAELWYLSRMRGPQIMPEASDVWHALDQCRERCLQVLESLPEDHLNQVVEVQGETWTWRKVFRRFLYHVAQGVPTLPLPREVSPADSTSRPAPLLEPAVMELLSGRRSYSADRCCSPAFIALTASVARSFPSRPSR